MRSSNIGGQAVMEGIMMRHKDKYSIAVRRPDQEIELKVEDYKCIFGNHAFLKKPIIRGVVSFVDSLVVGTKCLMYSAEIAGDEEDEETARKNEQLTEEERFAKKNCTQYMRKPAAGADSNNWGVNRNHQALDSGKNKGDGRPSGQENLSGNPYRM